MGEIPLSQVSVLLLEDDPLLRRQLLAFLERVGADVSAARDLSEARSLLSAGSFEVALLDVNVPDGLGTDLLREGAFSANTAVVMMTGEGGVRGAVEAMRLGARDYLTKPFEPAELPLVFARALKSRQAQRLDEHRREDVQVRDDEFLFGSALQELKAQLDKVLSADARMQTGLAPVLIEGETGTGKTTIARWLHARGPRAQAPLVEVNCSALPESLAESELFGHERGAFTDARTARIGLFEAASGGTLFLDELASLSMPLQAKVLTAIEDGRIRRVGGNRPIAVDVRVIAASNRPVRTLVARGQFREDLLHRLDLFRLCIPPLRDRPGDILPLAEVLMRRACRRHRLAAREISPEGQRRLKEYRWPGNARELSHEVERGLVFEDGPLTFRHLPGAGAPEGSTPQPVSTAPPASEWMNPHFRFPSAGFVLESAIDRLVARAVEQSGGNVSAAARLLGVSRDVVRYRMEGWARRGGEKPAASPGESSPMGE